MAQRPTTQMNIVENKDGSVTVMQPKGHKHKGVTVLLDSDDVLREQVGGFANFLRDYAVVGLAIGFIVGQQANAVVKQMVASFVDPWAKIVFGQDLSTRVAHFHHGRTPVPLPWGAFVYTLIEFFLVLITIYILIKLFRLDKLRQKKAK
jgi:large conductance mechanosensitive channel